MVFFASKVCLVIGLTIAGKDKDRFQFKHKNSDKKLEKICSDPDAAQEYLKQILSVIESLEANSTYTAVLQSQSANFLRYIKDSTNQNSLKENCEGFFDGLKSARKADKDHQRAQNELSHEIQKQLKQATKDISKGKNFLELDI